MFCQTTKIAAWLILLQFNEVDFLTICATTFFFSFKIIGREIVDHGQAPVVQRLDKLIQWISHYPTVSICVKISVFPLEQGNILTLTTVKFGSVRKPWTTFNVKYILDAEERLIQRIKLSSL